MPVPGLVGVHASPHEALISKLATFSVKNFKCSRLHDGYCSTLFNDVDADATPLSFAPLHVVVEELHRTCVLVFEDFVVFEGEPDLKALNSDSEEHRSESDAESDVDRSEDDLSSVPESILYVSRLVDESNNPFFFVPASEVYCNGSSMEYMLGIGDSGRLLIDEKRDAIGFLVGCMSRENETQPLQLVFYKFHPAKSFGRFSSGLKLSAKSVESVGGIAAKLPKGIILWSGKRSLLKASNTVDCPNFKRANWGCGQLKLKKMFV